MALYEAAAANVSDEPGEGKSEGYNDEDRGED
jgi:hypothetical protein